MVGAPWDDSTTNRPGARFGPRALRALAYNPGTFHLDLGIELFDALEVVDYGDAICAHGMVELSHLAIRERVAEVADRGIFPVILGEITRSPGRLRPRSPALVGGDRSELSTSTPTRTPPM